MTPITFNPSTNAATGTYGPRRVGEPANAPKPAARGADQAEFSSSSIRLSTDESDSPVRLDLVQRIREQLKADTYETPEKLDIAAQRAVIDLDVLA